MTGTDAAWADYQRVIDQARTRAMTSSWASTPQLRAQAAYYISMLQAFGFNLYMAPRQAYPTFFSHTIFTPVEYQWGAPSPDFRYHWTAIDGRRTYRIWGRRGNTRWLDIQAQHGWWGDADQRNLANWDIDEFELGADGSFEAIASADPQPGNWMKLDRDSHNICLLVRDVWDDWANADGATIHIECIDRAPSDTVLLSEAQIAERLGKIAHMTSFSVDWYQDMSDTVLREAGGSNRLWLPTMSVSNVGGNPRAVYIQMIYDLAEDEALIIDSEIPDCKYWSLQLADPWFQTTDYRFHASSINDKQARRDADGRVRIVLSPRDPGVPNWVDTAGLLKGLGMWRWYLSPSHPVPATSKVKLAEVRDHLPADTPTVSPAERAEMLATRQAQVARRFGF
ncbi:DUF1214 domain-containing protein [Sphingomonas histidinilytica]|jgi:hypothetical protein|uniref:DUF1214 domain-containing protein n=1 Tax=Rhizorhabdus histidinilytica TaxID=439228 RepID=A0A1T5A5G7_9SPHN|nr:DUF1214 domain-containing protein [Rhizorhabdus histidinilytica]MBO9376207.1 DUF1214 domain-containing protein [Rhizorhabdus histidinilytica]QEH78239.1 DUF1254 domain-containing protein [Sphingomonas sp. C8-2]SKB30145.1 Protein of unknown function [Rhizorhabdus histidinilytica]